MAGFEEVPLLTGARSRGQLKFSYFSPHAFYLEEKIEDSAAEGSPEARAGTLRLLFWSWNAQIAILELECSDCNCGAGMLRLQF